ncbi:MAG: RhuM family protein, partial [Bacteroidota bacterium]
MKTDTSNHQLSINSQKSNFLLYTANDGKINIEVFLKDETVWLTQKAIAELFGVQVPAINKHLKNIFEAGELEEKSVISILETTASDGKTYNTGFYNLDAIISVGYRVNSYQATQFRIWATKTLREFIIKGFVLNDERLKQGNQVFGKDYFDELLERIREIRASERRFYQKITDIYALSVDYDKNAPITKEFFMTVQNKLHWAITGKTAAEIIYASADASKIYMGLTNWKKSPDRKIL